MRILVVEDNRAIARSLVRMLEARKFAADVASDGPSGLDQLLRGTYDLAVVDVMLPGIDGFELTRRARGDGVQTPILMLTARDGVEDRIAGLECGADDYVAKPFHEAELIARVHAILRRGARPVVEAVVVGKLQLDGGARTIAYDGQPLELGATEFRLLELLARNAGRTFTRSELLERIWEYDFDGSSNIVDVYVSQLRRKLKRYDGDRIIETVWGVGYRLRA